MQRRFPLIFVFQVCITSLFAQGYIGYFSKTTAAETQIVAGNHAAALGLYEEAFTAYKKHFSKDLHNAAVCAMLKNDYPAAFRYLDSLIRQGVALKYFKTHPGLEALRKSEQWKPWLATYAAKHADFERSQRIADRRALEEMARLDQEFRKKPGSYAVWNDTIRKTDSLNILHFRKMVVTAGYPSDQEIGIETPCDLPNHYVVLRHYYQNKGYDLSDVLYQAVVDGNLEPQIFAELEDKKYTNYRYGTLVYLSSGKWHVDLSASWSNDSIRGIDAHRAAIGLESFGDYKEKIKFQMTNKQFCFKTYEGRIVSRGMPLEKFGKREKFSEN